MANSYRDRSGNTIYNNSFVNSAVVYDPVLPSPIVIVHSCAKNVFNKTNPERKHRGTSRTHIGQNKQCALFGALLESHISLLTNPSFHFIVCRRLLHQLSAFALDNLTRISTPRSSSVSSR